MLASFPASSLNQISDRLGIPFRFNHITPRSSWITGQVLSVDGGLTMRE
jgi:hypothetical protein